MSWTSERDRIEAAGLWSLVTDEPFFSWAACDLCGGIAGDRYSIKYKYRPRARDTFEADICADCLEVLANGKGA